MKAHALTTIASIYLIVVGIVLAALILQGCEMAHRIDEAIWTPGVDPDDPSFTSAPPLLELIAGGLALLGFGGMSAWIKRTNSKSTKSVAELEGQIASLSARLDAATKSDVFDKHEN